MVRVSLDELVQTDLRALAKGKPCQIRTPVCCFDPEQTVLCHYRSVGISGLNIKAPDVIAAWGCTPCHTYVDSNASVPRSVRDLLLLQGVARTLYELVKLGLVHW